MQELTQHLALHPYLAALAALLLVAVIVNEVRSRGQGSGGVSPMQTIQLMNQGGVVIDVRGNEAFAAGHIGESRNIAATDLANQADALKRYRDKPVVVCCDTGVVSGSAVRSLAALGFTQVARLSGGLNAWRRENLPLIKGAR